MAWKNFELWRDGWIGAHDGTKGCRCFYQLGMICTGKQRVFHRFAIFLKIGELTIWGEDPYSLMGALIELGEAADQHGWQLLVAGLDDRFRESGLSHNTGFGYINGHGQAIHMMAVPPPSSSDGASSRYNFPSLDPADIAMKATKH